MQMAETLVVIDSLKRTRVLEQRRCLLLAIVGSTAENSSNNPTLRNILNSGFLVKVKMWLDDILAGNVGEFVTGSVT